MNVPRCEAMKNFILYQIETPRKTIYTTHNGRCLVLMFNTTVTKIENMWYNLGIEIKKFSYFSLLHPINMSILK